ncbi:tyrosine-type recombinase/integrase [Streptomyces sp. NPDC002055]|uniref:tyrosine-type recombinase/integrase n=1 Tax=Streptomyces sp. NPDC002055 TaxID=3154534 RepID=UPI00332FAA73
MTAGRRPPAGLGPVSTASCAHQEFVGQVRRSLRTLETLPIRNQVGGMIYPDLFRKSWKRALNRLGLPNYNPHDLRHKWATVTLSNSVSIHEVSRWMGHSSIKITVDRYGHLTLDGSERCRQVIEATLGQHMLSGFPTQRVPAAEPVPA